MAEIRNASENYFEAVFSCLQSEFLIMPKETGSSIIISGIGGRGFGVRQEDMKKMILATRGKVFTLKTLDRLVEYTRLKEFKTRL